MSLGGNASPAWVGRPLDVSIPALLEGSEGPSTLCLDADVAYGDTRLDKSRIRVSAESVAATSGAIIHIRSATLVNEPIVTIAVRTGCQQTIERRFVILADIATRPVEPMAVIPDVIAAPANTGGSRMDSAAASDRLLQSQSRPAGESLRAIDAAPAAVTVRPPATAGDNAPSRRERSKTSIAPVKTQARLKLEPLDLSIEGDPQLRLSTVLLSVPTSSDSVRAPGFQSRRTG